MKILGWILLVFGCLAFLGSLGGGGSIGGSLFWIAVGAYLIIRAKKKQKEQENKEKWMNGESSVQIPANDKRVVEDKIKSRPKNQQYAIIKLLAYIQGASPQSAYSTEANEIVQSVILSLGLSQEEVGKIIQQSMNQDPEKEVDRIMEALCEIKDKDLLSDLYRKSIKLAEISGQKEMIALVKHIFTEIRG